MGALSNFSLSQVGGTSSEPESLLFTGLNVSPNDNSLYRIRADITWSGGKPSVVEWHYSTTGGSSYSLMLTESFTYTSGLVTAITGAASFATWLALRGFGSSGSGAGTNREAVITLSAGNGMNTLDWEDGGIATLTVTGSGCSIHHSNMPDGELGGMLLQLTNGGLTSIEDLFMGDVGTLRWPGGTVPTLQSAGIDIIALYTINGGDDTMASLVMPDMS
jgi:hypothetical protein